jgi:hypothetical protein
LLFVECRRRHDSVSTIRGREWSGRGAKPLQLKSFRWEAEWKKMEGEDVVGRNFEACEVWLSFGGNSVTFYCDSMDGGAEHDQKR